jgi:cell division protein FtsW (lipid II flippase)
MVFLWVGVSVIAVLMAMICIVDVVRRRPSPGSMIGWILLLIILPFFGSLIYWARRPTSRREVEQAYLAQRDQQRRL